MPQTDAGSSASALLPPHGPSRRIDRTKSLLLVVDIQQRLAPHIADCDALIARTQALLTAAARLHVPRLATEHCATQIGPLVATIGNRLEPHEIFAKTRFGAVDHPAFGALLARTARTQIVIVGMEAHVCVMQTALGLVAARYEVFVVGDAVGSRAKRQTDRALALARLREAGCTIVGTETVLFEWTGSGDDEAFGDMLKIVKALPAG